MLQIEKLDHLVLTVEDIDATCSFYTDVLGMREIFFKEGRRALLFGRQKINLHEYGRELEPKAALPTPGSADLCFVIGEEISRARQMLEAKGIRIVAGPVARTGALGPITSIYIRDPDQNLIELATYQPRT